LFFFSATQILEDTCLSDFSTKKQRDRVILECFYDRQCTSTVWVVFYASLMFLWSYVMKIFEWIRRMYIRCSRDFLIQIMNGFSFVVHDRNEGEFDSFRRIVHCQKFMCGDWLDALLITRKMSDFLAHAIHL
jgi:hypothetical protein